MPGLEDDSVERQELWCHNCSRYVQFSVDLELDGRHIIKCPNCDHEHYRVVNKGVISEERWGSNNNVPSFFATYLTSSTTSITASTSTTMTNLYFYTGTTSTGVY
jgi:hypothetical protein